MRFLLRENLPVKVGESECDRPIWSVILTWRPLFQLIQHAFVRTLRQRPCRKASLAVPRRLAEPQAFDVLTRCLRESRKAIQGILARGDLRDLYTESGQALQGSFSAVSKPKFAQVNTKYS